MQAGAVQSAFKETALGAEAVVPFFGQGFHQRQHLLGIVAHAGFGVDAGPE
jgi:hypothetical protein